MKFRQNIPNFITLGNLLCGCLAIVIGLSDPETACYLIVAAAILDVLDGLVARWLKVASDMGKQLDSLADVVSFGVAPVMLLLYYGPSSNGMTGSIHSSTEPGWHIIVYDFGAWIHLVPLVLVLASAWRLAKFNLDTRQTDHFRGLPTPANGLFWTGLVLAASQGHLEFVFDNPNYVIFGSLLFSVLMVSDLKLLNLKFKSLAWQGNEARYGLLVLSAGTALWSVLWMKSLSAALPPVLILYLLISLVYYYLFKSARHEKIQGRN